MSPEKDFMEAKRNAQLYKDEFSMLVSLVNAFCDDCSKLRQLRTTSEILVPAATFKTFKEQVNNDYRKYSSKSKR